MSEGLRLPEPKGHTLAEGSVRIQACVADKHIPLDHRPILCDQGAPPVGQSTHQSHVGDRVTNGSPGLHARQGRHHPIKGPWITKAWTERISLRKPASQAERAVVLGHGKEDSVGSERSIRKRCIWEFGTRPQPIVAGEIVKVTRLVVVHCQTAINLAQPFWRRRSAAASVDNKIRRNLLTAVQTQAGDPRDNLPRNGGEADDAVSSTNLDSRLLPNDPSNHGLKHRSPRHQGEVVLESITEVEPSLRDAVSEHGI